MSCCGQRLKLRTWREKKSCSVVFLPGFSRASLENQVCESIQGVWSGHRTCSSRNLVLPMQLLQVTMNFHYLGIKDKKWLLWDGCLDFSIFLSKLKLVHCIFNSLFCWVWPLQRWRAELTIPVSCHCCCPRCLSPGSWYPVGWDFCSHLYTLCRTNPKHPSKPAIRSWS